MIYIISKEALESSTERVIDWIDNLGERVIRINGEDVSRKDNIHIEIENNKTNSINFNNLPKKQSNNVGWYRRWGNDSAYPKLECENLDFNNLDEILSRIDHDHAILKYFILENLNIKHWLTDPYLSSMNKLEILSIANELEFSIPATIVATNKNQLQNFRKRHNDLIVKAISETLVINKEGKNYSFLTHILSDVDYDNLPATFLPTCFQELIHKKFEIRVFFLDGKTYSIAIFSQNDETTSSDFRNYNYEKPNRNVPFILPDNVSNKIERLMKKIGLNCASVDLILDNNNRYVFLEINPVGQFGMVSTPGNFFLEKKIAQYLINKKY